jgi:hypothetical protein
MKMVLLNDGEIVTAYFSPRVNDGSPKNTGFCVCGHENRVHESGVCRAYLIRAKRDQVYHMDGITMHNCDLAIPCGCNRGDNKDGKIRIEDI